MEIRWLNGRDDGPKLTEFRNQAALFEEMLEDGVAFPLDQDWTPDLKNPLVRYIGCVEYGRLWGYFRLVRQGSLFECHLTLDHSLRGKPGLMATIQALTLFWEEYPGCNLFCIIAMSNKPAVAFAYAAGFKKVGVLHRAFRKGGKWWGKVVMEMLNG